MIINALRARNVLKYGYLELKALPAKGMIAISGLNESGKSTIGETICFALFGQTFSLDPRHITKVIKWGEAHCLTSIEFTPTDGKRYRLDRFLDKEGNQGARLSLADQRQAFARGVIDVYAKLTRLIQFDYLQFIESFYLIQRDLLKTPHPHSVAVKAMAGVAALERVEKILTDELTHHKLSVEDLGQQMSHIEAQISQLGIREERLAELEDQRCLVDGGKLNKIMLVEKIKHALQACQDSISWVQHSLIQINISIHRYSASGHITLFFLLLAGAAWIAVLLAQIPQIEASPDWLKWGFLNLESDQDLRVLALSGILSLFFIGFWIRGNLLKWRLAWYKQNIIDRAITLGVRKQDLTDNKEIELAPALEGPLLDTEPIDPDGQFLEWAQAYMARVTALRDHIAMREIQISQEIRDLTQEVSKLDRAIAEEQERRRQGQILIEQIEKTKAQIKDHHHQIKVREYALELLASACRYFSRRFNTYIGIIAKTLLPSLTGGRYEHLKIDEDLNVQIFSTEKSDFMDIDEISSGTHRQIMLCIRLALSQALIKTAIRGPQFIFLDEPFAFSDEQRLVGAITALRRLHELFSQVFIIAQEFPGGAIIDKHIVCKREMRDLVLQGS